MIFLIGMLYAFAAGAVRVISRMVNSQLSQAVGLWESTFFNYWVGLATALICWWISHEPMLFMSQIGELTLPPWALMGGAIGVIFVVANLVTAPKLSAFEMTVLVFLGQVAAGLVIDMAMGELSLYKAAGGCLIALGLWMNQSAKSACTG